MAIRRQLFMPLARYGSQHSFQGFRAALIQNRPAGNRPEIVLDFMAANAYVPPLFAKEYLCPESVN
jgi:hypothetical protein